MSKALNTWEKIGLSDDEIRVMRKDAVDRVMKMQSIAKNNIEKTKATLSSQEDAKEFPQNDGLGEGSRAEGESSRQGASQNAKSSTQGGQRQSPLNLEGIFSSILGGKGKSLIESSSPIGKILDILSLDSERLLIGFLIILLLNEKADNMLILALCYVFF